MELSAHNSRVLITAAASGIGRTIAEAFLEKGARVHIYDVAADWLQECRAALPDIGATSADVADPAQVERLFAEVRASIGGLDVLVNCAGVAGPTAPVEEIALQDWERTLAVNLTGTFLCVRHAIPLLKDGSGGSIINISSAAGLLGYPWRAPYAASKWALIGFTKTLAMELGEFAIRVNAICPGAVEGPRMEAVIAREAQARGMSADEVRAQYERQTSLRTFVTAGDVANMALFLCCEAGSKISGQALGVDGHTEGIPS
ncbi:MAG TPA: SDR family oxidoreductase [Anaerolineales bacterium]|nr:SDR family oxidoreductase [Anaerolineales bacterium]